MRNMSAYIPLWALHALEYMVMLHTYGVVLVIHISSNGVHSGCIIRYTHQCYSWKQFTNNNPYWKQLGMTFIIYGYLVVASPLWIQRCYDAKFVRTDGTANHYDKLRCSQWRQRTTNHDDELRFSQWRQHTCSSVVFFVVSLYKQVKKQSVESSLIWYAMPIMWLICKNLTRQESLQHSNKTNKKRLHMVWTKLYNST